MSNAGLDWERLGRASGAIFVVIAAVAFIVMGEQPAISDAPEEIVAYFDGDRGRILTGTVLFGIALAMSGFFVGTIANMLREAGQGRVAATTIVLGGAFLAIQCLVTAVSGALALNIAAAGDAGLAHALYSLGWASDVLSAFPLAGVLVVISIGLSRVRAIPDWLLFAGLGAALVTALRGTNWARDGFWSPTGAWAIITIIVVMLWLLVTSVVLYRAAGAAPVAMAAPGPAMGGTVAP